MDGLVGKVVRAEGGKMLLELKKEERQEEREEEETCRPDKSE